jgi:hypothetical protein
MGVLVNAGAPVFRHAYAQGEGRGMGSEQLELAKRAIQSLSTDELTNLLIEIENQAQNSVSIKTAVMRLVEENQSLKRRLDILEFEKLINNAGGNKALEIIEQLQAERDHARNAHDDLLADAIRIDEGRVTLINQLQAELRRVTVEQTPYEAITTPIQGNADDSNIPPDMIPVNLDKSCFVAYRIAIRYGAQPEDCIIMKGKATFPGSLEEAIEEIPMLVDSAIARSPIESEIVMGGLINVSRKILWEVMFKLAMCYGDEFAAEKYEEMFNRLFHEEILPEEYPKNSTPAEIKDAREKFTRAVNDSFRNLRKNGRGTTKLAELKRGPKTGNVTG